LFIVMNRFQINQGHEADFEAMWKTRERHLDEFEAKWLHGGADAGELLVGNPDVSSLMDMSSSFDVVREMRLVPITRDLVVQLVVMTLLPIAPLLLTMISVEELLGQFVRIVF